MSVVTIWCYKHSTLHGGTCSQCEAEAESAPKKPQTLFDVHPLPWALGESKTSKADIVDANGRVVANVNTGGIIIGHPDTPKVLINLVNALQLEKA